jgi:hypothetical protein
MGKTTNVAANANPVKVIVTVPLAYWTRSFSPAPERKREEVNPRLSVSEGGGVCVCVEEKQSPCPSCTAGSISSKVSCAERQKGIFGQAVRQLYDMIENDKEDGYITLSTMMDIV